MVTNSEFNDFYDEIQQYAKVQGFTVNCHVNSPVRATDTTTGVVKSIVATLWPTHARHIEFIIAQANYYVVPLHPISCGKNWGYSDATPSCDSSVIIDLSQMNQILEINQQQNFAIIEPGVTQQQLSDALVDTGLFMDCTGSSTGSSVVGNILERGFGHTEYGDRFSHSCAYEMVLGNGKMLRTGHLAYDGANEHQENTCHSARTTGPSVEGLFSQSNFGIVTKLCIWLMPVPPQILPYLVVFATHDDFLNAIEPISRLKALGVTTSTMHIGNKMRILSSSISWQDVEGMMPEAEINSQLKQLGYGSWVMSGALYGSKVMVKARKKELVKALKAKSRVKITFLAPGLISTVAKLLRWSPQNSFVTLKTQLATAQGLIDMHTGKPTNLFLKGCYHRHPDGYPSDYDSTIDIAKDGCGMIWLSPTTPASKASVSRLLSMLTEIFEVQGFHLYATLSFISARSIAVICNPIFDPTDPAQVQRAQNCTTVALTQCIENGFPPYRVSNVQWGSFYQQLSSEHQALLTAIKSHLDPNNIISPGRYGVNSKMD